jgi:hypothetical protein
MAHKIVAVGPSPPSGSPAMISLGSLEIDAAAYGSQGNAILGTKDSGKTYTATFMAERLFAAGVPFTVFDPVGIWRFLRVPGAGPGLPVAIAGGAPGDLPLTPATAASIVEAAMQAGVSLVLDLYSMELSKADWRRIVRDSVKLLLHKNAPHGLRHIFIEEAHEFVPQLVTDGLVYAEVEKLCVMGGNARLGYTLVSPRSEQLNKAVLELCENLFLHRQRGRNSLVALGKWLKIGNVADHQAIISTLSTLPSGECWAWVGGSDVPVRVKVPTKNSFHPNRRLLRGEAEMPARASVDVEAFVAMMAASLPGAGSKPEAGRKHAAADGAIEAARAASYQDGLVAGRAEGSAEVELMRGFLVNVAGAIEHIREVCNMVAVSAGQLQDGVLSASVGNLRQVTPGLAGERQPNADSMRVGHSTRVDMASSAEPRRLAAPAARPVPVVPRAREAAAGADAELTTAARRFLGILAQRAPASFTWGQLATLGGMKARGGSYSAAVRSLRASGTIEEGGGLVWAAAHVVGDHGRPMTPAEVLTMWCDKLPAPAPAMLRALAAGPLTRDELAEQLDLQPRGGFWTKGLGMLRGNGLVEIHGGEIRLAELLR